MDQFRKTMKDCPSIIILDSTLPDGTGREALRQFREIESNIYNIYIYIYDDS